MRKDQVYRILTLTAIESWCNEKAWRLFAGPHDYPKKRITLEKQSTFLSMITLSDPESEDEDIWICSVNINLAYACFIKQCIQGKNIQI